MTRRRCKTAKRPGGWRRSARAVLKSAKSGKFVSKKFAKRHPNTTYWQRLLGAFAKYHPER